MRRRNVRAAGFFKLRVALCAPITANPERLILGTSQLLHWV